MSKHGSSSGQPSIAPTSTLPCSPVPHAHRCPAQEVCLGITQLLQARPDVLEAQLGTYLAYILHAMQHSDSAVALEAAEFWAVYLECQLPAEPLLPVLPQLVQLLLTFMVRRRVGVEGLGVKGGTGVPDMLRRRRCVCA